MGVEQRHQFPLLGGRFPIEQAAAGEQRSLTDVVQTPRSKRGAQASPA